MSSVDTNVFMRPTPAKVAALVDSHSLEAAVARWYWLDKRTICSLAQAGRAAHGVVHRKSATRRAFSDLDAAVCVEASCALGSMARGERASGVPHNSTRGLFPTRGLDYVRIPTKERAQATMMGIRAKAGCPEAIAGIERRHAHEIAVGEVLRRALALVPEQPCTGRYRLPPVDDALREVLAGLPTAAIEAVFPDLASVAVVEIPAPAPAEEAAPVAVALPDPAIEVPPVTHIPETDPSLIIEAAPVRRRGKMPANDVLRADHAAGARVADLAVTYDVSQQAIYQAWSRLGLAGRGRFVRDSNIAAAQNRAAAQVGVTAPPADVPAEPAALVSVAPPLQDSDYGALSPDEAVAVVAGIEAKAPLCLYDLGRAVDLAALKGLTPAVAISWIRADIHSVAMGRVIPPAETEMTAAMADAFFLDLIVADEKRTRQ